jgi:hypothetical protein
MPNDNTPANSSINVEVPVTMTVDPLRLRVGAEGGSREEGATIVALPKPATPWWAWVLLAGALCALAALVIAAVHLGRGATTTEVAAATSVLKEGQEDILLLGSQTKAAVEAAQAQTKTESEANRRALGQAEARLAAKADAARDAAAKAEAAVREEGQLSRGAISLADEASAKRDARLRRALSRLRQAPPPAPAPAEVTVRIEE